MFDSPIIEIPCVDGLVSSGDILFIELVYINRSPKLLVRCRDNEQFSKLNVSVDAMGKMIANFGFVRVDSGVLANLNHFSRFEKTVLGEVYLHFINSDIKVKCSRPGHRKAKKILDNKS